MQAVADLGESGEGVDEVVIDAETQHDVEGLTQLRGFVDRNALIDLDRWISKFLGEPQAGAVRPVLADVVGRENAPRATLLGVKAPVSVPAADLEHALAGKIDLVEPGFDEPPDAGDERSAWDWLTARNPSPKSNS